jgi:hypothetical protein
MLITYFVFFLIGLATALISMLMVDLINFVFHQSGHLLYGHTLSFPNVMLCLPVWVPFGASRLILTQLSAIHTCHVS